MDSPPSERSPVSILPIEILSEIFHIHVNANHGSRWSLLLTSRTWYRVATNLSSLWSSLYLGDGIPPEKPPEMLCCTRLEHLMVAITRTGSAGFSLCVFVPCCALREGKDKLFTSLIEIGWLGRCRSLDLITISTSLSGSGTIFNPSAHPKRIGNLFASQSFRNLEHLSIQHRYVNPGWERVLGDILLRVEGTTNRLDSLRLIADNPAGRCGVSLVVAPRILRHLRTLSIVKTRDMMPWTLINGLERLSIKGSVSLEIPGQYAGITASLRDLSIDDYPRLDRIPTTTWRNLTRLTIIAVYQRWNYLTGPVRLPNLTSLTLCSYQGDLSNFDIPRLHELTIQCYIFQAEGNFYPSFLGANISPRILKLAHNHGHDSMVKFLEAQELWNRVEELHITTLVGRICLESRFEEALAGTVARGSFPALRILSVLHPNYLSRPIRDEEKKEGTRLLGEIAQARGVTEGLGPLEAVSIGWYRAPTITTLRDPSRAQWRFEWRDCLAEGSE